MSDNLPGESHTFPSDETIRAQVESHVTNEDLERLAAQISEALINANRYLIRIDGVADYYRDPVANGLFFAHRCLRDALHNLHRGQHKIYGTPPDDTHPQEPRTEHS